MKQRLSLALALLEEPDFLILDEPFVGLDPVGVQSFIEYIQKIRSQLGVTVLISSHQLSEIEGICDYFLVIKDRKLRRYLEISQSKLCIWLSYIPDKVRSILSNFAIVEKNVVLIANNDGKLSELFRIISKERLTILKVTVEKNLENVFVR